MQKFSGKDIVDRIDSLLIQRNEKRKALCDAVGISVQPMTSWVHRGSLPSFDVAYKIAQYFDVSMEWLLTGTERNAPEIPNDVLELARDIAAMPPVVKESLTAQIDVFKRNSHAESQTDTEIPSDTASSA